jgi:ribosomal protein L11 methyltransferase
MSLWTSISLRVPSSATEAAEACLLACGAVSVTLQAASAEELFAVHGGDAPLWQEVQVDGLFESGTVWPLVRETIARDCPEARLLPMQALADQDWATQFQQYAVDATFGNRLRLAPRSAPPSPAPMITVRLDPGMAFGTGSHPTTRMW